MFEGAWGGWLAIAIVALIAGLVGGFFIARAVIKKEQLKHPPINESMIRAMYQSMGRKPSEADILRTMNAIKRQQK